MNIIEVPIEKIANWKLNPRSIHEEDIKRLIWQIENLGVYKPLLVTRALKKDDVGDAEWVALGGNQRLKAFNKLGIKEVHCSVVKADSQKKRIEYSLSDNDRAGSYEKDMLNDLVFPEMDNLDMDMFKLDLGELTGLDEFSDSAKMGQGIELGEVKYSNEESLKTHFNITFLRKDRDDVKLRLIDLGTEFEGFMFYD